MSKTLETIVLKLRAGKDPGTGEPHMTEKEAVQQILQWVNDEVIGKNYGRSIIGKFNDKDARANKLVNETLDFANARLEKQRAILKQHGWIPPTNPKNIKEDE